MLGLENTILIISLIGSGCCLNKDTKDVIGFPEIEENLALVNKQNRSPVFLPSMCPENELLYPGDQRDDWICDCRPGHLFYPQKNKCWPAFRMGPCEAGQYLILPRKSVLPTCVQNPCDLDNYVLFNGRCEALGSSAPCYNEFPPSLLWVNATTLTVQCETTNIESRFSQTEMFLCPPGCKRSIENRC